jgi:hypothetical protein
VWGEKGDGTIHTHVSKCKNDKIKEGKEEKLTQNYQIHIIFINLLSFYAKFIYELSLSSSKISFLCIINQHIVNAFKSYQKDV